MKKLACCFVFLSMSALTMFAQEPQYKPLVSSAARGDVDAAYQLYLLAKSDRLYPTKKENRQAEERYFLRAVELGHQVARYLFAVEAIGTRSANSAQVTAFAYLRDLEGTRPGSPLNSAQYFDVHRLLGACYEQGKGIRPNSSMVNSYYLFASLNSPEAKLGLIDRMLDFRNPLFSQNAALEEAYSLIVRRPDRKDDVFDLIRKRRLVGQLSEFIAKRADAGDDVAQMTLADSMFTGSFFPREVTRAINYYRKAADLGNADAALKLADIYAHGLNFTKQDVAESIAYYEQALDSDSTRVRAAKGLFAIFAKDYAAVMEKKNAEEKKLQDLKPPARPNLEIKVAKSVEERRAAEEKRKAAQDAYDKEMAAYQAARGVIEKELKAIYEQAETLRAKLFLYSMLAEDFKAAREYAKLAPTQNEALYLDAYEYAATHRNAKKSAAFRELLTRATVNGYPLAVLDLAEATGRFRIAEVIDALENSPMPHGREWMYRLSVAYAYGTPATNPRYDAKKACDLLRKSAELGCLPAIERLAALERNGDSALGIAANSANADALEQRLLLRDASLRRPDLFKNFIADFESGKSKIADPIALMVRSAERNPYASFTLAKLYLTGAPKYKIEKDPSMALVLLHVAGEYGYKPAIDMLADLARNGIPKVLNSNSDFAEKYSSLTSKQ